MEERLWDPEITNPIVHSGVILWCIWQNACKYTNIYVEKGLREKYETYREDWYESWKGNMPGRLC